MNIETYRDHCLSKQQATEGFPFPGLPDLLVFKVGGKMFTAADVSLFGGFSIRVAPEFVDELRATYPAVQKAPYLSERHWVKIVLNNTIPDSKLLEWIDDSYQLAVAKLTKRLRAALNL